MGGEWRGGGRGGGEEAHSFLGDLVVGWLIGLGGGEGLVRGWRLEGGMGGGKLGWMWKLAGERRCRTSRASVQNLKRFSAGGKKIWLSICHQDNGSASIIILYPFEDAVHLQSFEDNQLLQFSNPPSLRIHPS